MEEFYDNLLRDENGSIAYRVLAIGLEKFSMLETTSNDSLEFDDSCYYKILSPLMREDVIYITSYTKEQFINRIMSRVRFGKLVNDVYDAQKERFRYNLAESNLVLN